MLYPPSIFARDRLGRIRQKILTALTISQKVQDHALQLCNGAATPPQAQSTPQFLPAMASEPPTPSEDPSNYDPNKWRNWFNLFLGRMSPGDQQEFREAVYIQKEAKDVARCEEYRDWCFQYSPTVIFLRQQLQALNGDLNSENVICRRCPARRDEKGRIFARQGGGFNPEAGVLICANEMRDRKHLEDTLAHEMVHAWDHLRWKVDLDDLRHAACTEVCFTFYGWNGN
jgi:hypothetical protein